MLFMVIERFKDRDAVAVYRRARDEGRMLPAGLRYVDSWVAVDLDRCFQLMESEDPRLFVPWIAQWRDLADFEVVAVAASTEVTEAIADLL
jgi:Protein of unknown function (DUF3303)